MDTVLDGVISSGSLPARERGLKHVAPGSPAQAGTSLPARERGLKQCIRPVIQLGLLSLPARERGLKHRFDLAVAAVPVAPRAGAWIETIKEV